MSRTLSQLDLGTSVYLEENGTPKEYILMKKDIDGCILLRAQALVARRINPTNVSNYEGSEMDNWLVNEKTGYMSLFNTATKNAIISRSRPTFDFGDSECRWISRRAFLLTHGEMFNSTATALEPLTTLVPALFIWKGTIDANSARICKSEADTAVIWWLSSPSSAAYVSYVIYNGTSNSSGASNTSNWARPALNVASVTIVSDEGADRIYLMPAQSYREVSFSGKALEVAERPIKAVVEYEATNLYDVVVEVCNNYGDASPVWVPCTSGVEVDLTNTVKQTTDWQVGVRCYGKSQGYGYFEEPIVKLGVA
jgi:hypothetical protein